MTDWTRLAEPFPDTEVKQRPGAAKWDHKEACQGARCRDARDPDKHHQFSYVDARVVAQRLDDVLTPAGWEFTWSHIPGESIVHGRLVIDGIVREDAGYPNSDRDEEPLKAAVSDALKRCAVLFGIGRHLYDDNSPRSTPVTRRAATPPAAPPRPTPIRRDEDLLDPDEEDIDALTGGPSMTHCECGDPWKGEPGDLWHKTADGQYHRHPDNVRKPRASNR